MVERRLIITDLHKIPQELCKRNVESLISLRVGAADTLTTMLILCLQEVKTQRETIKKNKKEIHINANKSK